MISLLELSSSSSSPRLSRETLTISSNNLVVTTGGKASVRHYGLDKSCCCDVKLCLGVTESTSRQPFCGWEQRMLPSAGSSHHIIITQNSDQSLGPSSDSHRETSKTTNGSFTKSKPYSHRPISYRRTDSKSLVRSYIHTEPQAIPYKFEHHIDSDTFLYIDKYRKTITYPRMEQKSMPVSGAAAPGEMMSMWSSRCVPSPVLIKPKLFVLGEGPTVLRPKPFTRKKV